MENKDLIPVVQFCDCHDIEFAFIRSLQEYGLLEIRILDDQEYFERERLPEIESMVRMHYDLGVNLEALDVISNLLTRIKDLQRDVQSLQNKLSFYS